MPEENLNTKTGKHAVAVAFMMSIAWGSEAWAKNVTFDTAPVKQGRVSVDGKFIGVAPVTVDLKIPVNGSVATTEKEGALGLWPALFDKSQKGAVVIRLEEDQAYKQTIVSDVANKWQTIEPSTQIDEDEAWKKIISIVTDNFNDIEQLDRASFYMRTAWKVRRFAYSVTRQRMVIKRGVAEDLTVKVQIESQVHYLSPTAAGTSAQNAPPPRDDDYEQSNRVFAADADTLKILREQL